MAPHSSTLAWKIPWMEEPGRLLFTGSHRVGQTWLKWLNSSSSSSSSRASVPTTLFFLLLLFSSRCFQNAALGPVIFSITWELARNENYLPPPLTYWIRTPELRLRNLLTNHTSRWIWDIPSVKPTPVFLRGDSHGQRSLVGYSP